jgi:heme-degrading monooxygenase HmoA
MHAVVVRVTVRNREGAEQRLRDEVVPQVSRAPGFQAGYWTRDGDSGLSMIIFDSEDNARAAADRVPTTIPEDVTLEGVEMREVVASA